MARLVALDLPGGPVFVDALTRILDAGDAALPLDQRLAPPARRRLIEAMAPAAVVGGDGEEVALRGGRPVEPGDALVVATSGTEGEAKGVVLTRDAVLASARATSSRLAVDPARDRWCCCLPVAHVGGLSVVLRALLTGTPLEVLPGFDAVTVMAGARRRGVTLVSLVPTALRRIGPEGAAAFRTIVLGGSAPPEALPGNVVTTYGMTETGSGVVYDGLALDGVEVRIGTGRSSPGRREDGTGGAGGGGGAGGIPGGGGGAGGIPGGGEGEIELRGPMLLRAYRDGSSPLDAEGWLATGDAGRLGPDGRLAVSGRMRELIITGGENVWPAPVEAVLGRHPAVAEVAVAGAPDAEWGERVVAYVVPAAGGSEAPSLAELRELVSAELGAVAAPKQLVLVEALPRTAIGKVRRHELGRMVPDAG